MILSSDPWFARLKPIVQITIVVCITVVLVALCVTTGG
jgi:hypothetical protein